MKTRILFILLISFGLQGISQNQILFQSDQKKSYLISYTNSYDENQIVINEMLEVIGKFMPKPIYQTKFTFTLDESVKITRDKNIVTIFVDYQNINLSGDILYKGFDMTDVLIPSKYDFIASLFRNKNTLLADYTPTKTNFSLLFNESQLQFIDTSRMTNYDFAINTFKFYYDNVARMRFRDKISLIDQYFIVQSDINQISKQLSDVNPNAYESIENTQKNLNEIKSKLDNIITAAFWQALQIDKYDPLSLQPKLSDLQKNYQEIQKQLNITLSEIHQLYYNKGLTLYNNKKNQEAKTNFEKSLYYRPDYAPSQYFLALIAYESKKYNESKEQLIKLFSFKYIDEETRQAAHELAYTIEWTDINASAALLNQEKFEDALAAVNKAETFCKSIPSFTCNDTIDLIRKDCYNGIYNQYIKNAGNSFTLTKIDKAEIEINKAIEYQQQYQKYIKVNEAAEELLEKIKIEQYYAAIAKGKEEMDAHNYRNAFISFKKAGGLEELYPVKKDKQLPELIKSAKLEVLLIMLNESESAVGARDLTKARNILKQVIDEQISYKLNDNTKLSQRVETLKKAILSQECSNAQRDYDEKISSAEMAVNQISFIQAETNYTEALKIIKANPDCGINDEKSVAGLKNVNKPSQYQKYLAECTDLAKSYKYTQSIEAYNKLKAYYQANIQELGAIVHQSLQEYIATFEYGFVMQGITWFVNNDDPDNGFFLLKVLRQRNVNKSVCKSQQLSLARIIALRDYKAGNIQNARLEVTEYTLGDKWYSYFSNEYLKQIKKFNK
jgi:hypothetical protein